MLLGFVVVLATTVADLGPRWFPTALVVTSLPRAWAGGALHEARRSGR